METGARTSLTEIPVCNERLYQEVAALQKMHPSEVADMVKFYGQFIASIMRKGQMEAVMIPKFGKFRPRVKKIRAIQIVQAKRASGMHGIKKAIAQKGFPKPKTDENEAV